MFIESDDDTNEVDGASSLRNLQQAPLRSSGSDSGRRHLVQDESSSIKSFEDTWEVVQDYWLSIGGLRSELEHQSIVVFA
jgi:hypothetical protein